MKHLWAQTITVTTTAENKRSCGAHCQVTRPQHNSCSQGSGVIVERWSGMILRAKETEDFL